ncbi:hypothetical protein EIP91_007854 [Steccherinum ochraceum]|uniref:Uncharacterized protein n=1 Tax=Steccherinum ochraceum TaxID=92696 RepID=A0A4R0R9E3_9APHY|nr:hypothetical protein EIP91_007854 [Steccherinum ochraceum]
MRSTLIFAALACTFALAAPTSVPRDISPRVELADLVLRGVGKTFNARDLPFATSTSLTKRGNFLVLPSRPKPGAQNNQASNVETNGASVGQPHDANVPPGEGPHPNIPNIIVTPPPEDLVP